MERKKGIIYESTRNELISSLSRNQLLEQRQGIDLSSIDKENWEDLIDLIENEDEIKLGELRQELKKL